MKPRRSFNLYSAEEYDRTGRGNLSCVCPKDMPDSEIESYKKARRLSQKNKNDDYRKQHPSTTRGRIALAQGEDPGKKITVPVEVHYSRTPKEEKADTDTKDEANSPRRPGPEIIWQPDVELKLDQATGNSTVLIGSSKAGKTTVMMHLFEKYYGSRDFVSVLFAGNPQLAAYKAPKLIVVDKYEPGLIRMAHKIQKETDNHYKFAFMLDDMLEQRDDRTLKNLVLSYRNSEISSVACLQYTNLLAKNSRANVNNILLFRFNSEEATELAVKQFTKAFFRRLGVEPEDMIDFYKRATANHGFIYIHPASDTISFHRLPPPTKNQ